ncbi:MAG TPA: GTPase, partial [Opitutaceae bacterium]
MFRSVVIVGRPNVGKSRLFNRLARKRISIVHDQPGVTRDVISAQVEDGYTLMDTGGLGLRDNETSSVAIIKASEKQVGFAIDTAALILFIIDGLDQVTALDDRIAKRLRQSGKDVILVVNKADFGDEKADHEGVMRLGLGDPIFVSAEHGRGESDLRDAILARIG